MVTNYKIGHAITWFLGQCSEHYTIEFGKVLSLWMNVYDGRPNECPPEQATIHFYEMQQAGSKALTENDDPLAALCAFHDELQLLKPLRI